MTVTIQNDKVELYLDALVRTGLFGHTRQEAARRLIERQLLRLLDEESHLFAGMKKTSTKGTE